MAKLDDLIDELRTDGREDDAEELEKLRGSALRDKAKERDKFAKELEEAKAEIESLKRGPKVREAFTKAGIDFDALSKLERRAIENYDGELDEDAIGDFIEENELTVNESSEGEEKADEKPAAAKVADAARRSAEGRGAKAPQVKPEDLADWPMDKKLRFMEAHPDAWEDLKRGETVVGVSP